MVTRPKPRKALVYCFPDTNFFYHYKHFREVDWHKLLNGKHVRIVITAPVLAELDKHKNDRASRRRRDRSRKIIKELEKLMEGTPANTPVKLKRSTEILLNLLTPNMGQYLGRLDPASQDDKIIGHILQFKADNIGAEVLLLSADLGMRLKARELGIEIIAPPEELRLKDEPTKAELEQANLQKELQGLKERLPSAALYFAIPQGIFPKVVFYRTSRQLADDQLAATVDKRKGELIFKSRLRGRLKYKFPHEERQIEIYMPKYQDYLTSRNEYLEFASNLVQLSFGILNSGTTPAEDVVVEVQFPDSFRIFYTIDDLPKEPREPSPPQIGALTQRASTAHRQSRTIGPIAPTTSQWEPRGPASARYSFDKIIHNVIRDLDPLVVEVPQMEGSVKYELRYQVHAANLPEPVGGVLTLQIEEKDGE